MPRVFMSYARGDVSRAVDLEKILRARDVEIWRDQESLYGGEQWPKTIGEAIASRDFLLLLWSQNAASSHFVEFEWTTAVALRKPVIPCLLDDTPLPAALRGIHAVDLKDPDRTVPGLLTALQALPPGKVPQQHTSDVIARLREIKAIDPEKVAGQAKAIFAEQGWTVQGNVYQAGGDIHVTVQQPAELPRAKSKLETVVKIVTVIFLAVGILIGGFTLLDKAKEKFGKETTHLTGSVETKRPDGSLEPVPGATVEVEQLPGKPTRTTTDGGFGFEAVPGKPYDQVRVLVTMAGYEPGDEYVSLPGPKTILLEKAK